MNFVVERAGFRPEVTHTELTVLCLVNIQQVGRCVCVFTVPV